VSAHPLHGTAPLARALRVEVQSNPVAVDDPGRVRLWKCHPDREGWGSNGGRFFTGTRVQAESRATKLGIPSSDLRPA
jgi:hypothetical protein